MKTIKLLAFAGVAVALCASVWMTGCKGSGSTSKADSTQAGDENTIMGAGATFPNPLYSKMFSEYNKATNLMVNYQSIGSGGGIKALTDKTVDFGASDAPLNAKQDSGLSAPAIHIPITAGAVVLSYNLPDFKDTLKLTPELIAKIFLGDIKKWNDAKIAAVNKGVKLPSTDIVVVYRSDGSGTSNIFTTYLDKVNEDWHTKVGKGNSVKWLTGVGGKGNEGVSGTIKQTPGGIGYIELAFAIQNAMPFAKVENKSKNFITPSIASITSAANIEIPADAKVSLTNTEAADGYPISGLTWILVYKEQKYGNHTAEKATKMLKLIQWMVHEGQQYCAPLNYAPLSENAMKVADAQLKTVTFDGKPILQ